MMTSPFDNRLLRRVLALVLFVFIFYSFSKRMASSLSGQSAALTQSSDPIIAMEDLVIEKTPDTIAPGYESVIDYVVHYREDDLRFRLSKAFPYNRSCEIPALIWQTWKESLDQVKNTELRNYMNTWSQSEGYDYHLIQDDELEMLVLETYADFPEILDALAALPLNILKFDFFRYLILYAYGGLYTDIDTHLIKDLREWVDDTKILTNYFQLHEDKRVGFLLGIEGDLDREDWKLKISRRVQFCQWTMKSKKGHPILRELIYKITKITLDNYNQRLNHVKIGTQYYTLHSVYTVLEWTGPGIFTDMVFAHLNTIYDNATIYNTNKAPHLKFMQFEESNRDKNTATETKRVGWMNFTRITKPVLFDDVLVLPINSLNGFADGIEFPVDDDLAYVKHEFHGSWKQ
jgi:alpha 1,6-mannosyltransferase